ncbi:MAG: pyrroline-5-carboxylate reductase [Erysipelotrichaceae bacterium]
MNNIIGFIGCGNMGKAIAQGMLSAGIVEGKQVMICDHHPENLASMQARYHVELKEQAEVARASDILILAVKPHRYASVIDEIRDLVKKDVVIVDIAAGQSIANVQRLFKSDMKVARAMPNTPAQVQAGMSALCFSENVEQAQRSFIYDLFTSFGRCEIIDEKIINSASSASGASPAFVYMFIEAMADGAVRLGMKRSTAYIFCAQAVLGAAKMVLESGEHPGALKDAVCSPGGSTIEGVAVLEERGMRSAVMDALLACEEKSKKMAEANEK